MYFLVDCTNVVTAVASPIAYPTTSPYLANAFCIWRIELAANTRVKTVIDPVDIEASTTPYNDFLLMFDGPTCTSPILSRIAGSTVQTVVASGNNTSFMFISNGATEMTGFTATASEGIIQPFSVYVVTYVPSIYHVLLIIRVL
ncbi:hypothetical protein PHET_12120 [Paragonimus heterotremus]|uniref:CUB domain-containing protein n=1 Tax=Paragonimus heterotremus TaxID=100268 RepID=A0A8J4SSR6_9TREM|nr:hypothetical protein PHET_12120 [Paragonimus heterotremus]